MVLGAESGAGIVTYAAGGEMDADWMIRGKCKDLDPAIFFPNDWVGVQVAQRICADCPVKGHCLEYALGEPCGPRGVGRGLRT